MPRIRTIKPEIASDAKLAGVSRDARYTFVLLITQADDEGLVAAAHRQLLGALYPHDDDVTVGHLLGWIEELIAAGTLRWRSTRDGSPVLELVNWTKHQRVDNKGKSHLAATLSPVGSTPEKPAARRRTSRKSAAGRGEPPQVAAEIRLDLGPGSGTMDPDLGPPPGRAPADEPPTDRPAAAGEDPAPTPPTGGSSESAKKGGGWPARLADVWGERLGLMRPARFGRVLEQWLSPKGDLPPLFTSEQACRALAAYLDQHRSRGSVQHATPEDFSRQFRHWVEYTTPVGELSPEQQRILGCVA